jgi:L-lactate permease
MRLSAGVGRICAPVSLIVRLTGGGDGRLGSARARVSRGVLCGVTFAGLQFAISNFVGPQLTDLIASLCALGVLVVLFMFWKPKDSEKYELSAAAKAAESGTFRRTSVPGLEPVLLAGRLRSCCGAGSPC